MKNSNDTIGNRTRDLPTCSEVPQPTAPPRTQLSWYVREISLLRKYCQLKILRQTFHPVMIHFQLTLTRH